MAKKQYRTLVKEFRSVISKYIEDESIVDWIASLYFEIGRVKSILERRCKDERKLEEDFEYFIKRLAKYKEEYPRLGGSGDFELIKRIILAEIRLDELDSQSYENLSEEPKLMEAFTRLHSQLTKDLETLGTTAKQKAKEKMDQIKVIIDYAELKKQSITQGEEWLEEMASLPGEV